MFFGLLGLVLTRAFAGAIFGRKKAGSFIKPT
jgi:hypothetical protein